MSQTTARWPSTAPTTSLSAAPSRAAARWSSSASGILTLTADNTYSGNTIVAAGSLEVGNGGTTGSIVGDVLNNGSLAFNRADALVYGGAVSGNGVFTKAGAGTLTLTGNSTYTGNTTVGAGTLNVVGSLGPTAVSVAGGATLTGSGIINGPVTVQSGGILSGGGGTLGLGALTLQAGATTNVLVNGPGFVPFDVAGDFTAAGTLNVTTAGGYGRGVYHVVEYGGTFANNGLAIGSSPPGFITEINTESPQQLNIKVYDDPTATQFWRGDANPVGGNGTWSSSQLQLAECRQQGDDGLGRRAGDLPRHARHSDGRGHAGLPKPRVRGQRLHPRRRQRRRAGADGHGATVGRRLADHRDHRRADRRSGRHREDRRRHHRAGGG